MDVDLSNHRLGLVEDAEADVYYRCRRCGTAVSGWAIEEGVWPAVIGWECPAVEMLESWPTS